MPDAEPLALAVRLLEDMAGGGDAPHATVGGVVNKAGTPHALRFDSDDLGCDLVDMLTPLAHVDWRVSSRDTPDVRACMAQSGHGRRFLRGARMNFMLREPSEFRSISEAH